MKGVKHILTRTRRRAVIHSLLRNAARGLLAGIAAGLLILAADRGLNLAMPWWAFVIPVVAGLLIAIVVTLAAAPSLLQIAVRLDRALHLKDQLATARLIEAGRVIETPFAPLVQHEADRLAERLDSRSAFPIRATREWAIVPLLAAALIAGVLFLPARSVARLNNAETNPELAAANLLPAQQDILQTIRETTQEIPPTAKNDEAIVEQMEALERLSEQLTQPPRTEQEFRTLRDEAAQTMAAMAQQLDEQAQRDFAAMDELARSMNDAASSQSPMSAAEFIEAMKRGEFGKASDVAEQLLNNPDAISAEQREQIAREFRGLGEAIRKVNEPSASETTGPAERQRENVEQTLRDAGIDEPTLHEMIEPSGKTSPEQTQRELERNGVNEELARKLARQIEQMRREQQVRDRAQRDANELAQRMREAADELTNPQEQPGEERGGDQSADPQTAPREQPVEPRAASPGDERPDSPSSATEKGAKPDSTSPDSKAAAQDQKPQTSKSPPQPGEKPAGSEQPQREQKTGQSQSPRPEESGSEKIAKEPAAEGESRSGAKRAAPEPREPSHPDEKSQQPTTEMADQDAAPGREAIPQQAPSDQIAKDTAAGEQNAAEPTKESQSPQPTQPPTGTQGLVEKLKELAQRTERTRQRQRDSEQIRRAAERIAEQLTDEERRELARWARQWDKQQTHQPRDLTASSQDRSRDNDRPGSGTGAITSERPDRLHPSNVETINAGGEEIGDEIVATWLADREGQATPEARAQAREAIRSAQRQAERAVNQSAVPPRYHELIRKYFGHLPATVEPGDDATNAPASGPGASP